MWPSRKAFKGFTRIRSFKFKINEHTRKSNRLKYVKIKPILLNASKIRGGKQYEDSEKGFIKLCKLILSVGWNIKNDIGLGEYSGYNLHLHWKSEPTKLKICCVAMVSVIYENTGTQTHLVPWRFNRLHSF